MATLNSHGGGCCGMRHIFSFNAFDNGSDYEISFVDSLIRRNIEDQKNIEIIFNEEQVRHERYKPVLDYMARVGFVLVGVYLNSGSGTNNYIFHRAQERRPLTTIGDVWTGQYMTPSLQGTLLSRRTEQHTWNTTEQRHANPDFELPTPRFPEPVTPPPLPDQPPIATHLFTTYHNIYRDGRVGAGYDTVDAARDVRRGNGLIRARMMIWNGTETVTEWREIV